MTSSKLRVNGSCVFAHSSLRLLQTASVVSGIYRDTDEQMGFQKVRTTQIDFSSPSTFWKKDELMFFTTPQYYYVDNLMNARLYKYYVKIILKI